MPDRSPKKIRKGRVREKLHQLIYRNPLYGYTLVGRTPKRLLGTPPELIPGNAAKGQLILAGNLTAAGQRFSIGDIANIPEKASQQWQTKLHSFHWLSDLRAVGNNQARLLARTHITAWLDTYKNWSPLAWRTDTLGQRLTNWIIHFGFFTNDATQEFFDLFFLEIVKQARHLNRCILRIIDGPGRIQGLKGLIYCGVSVPGCEKYLQNGLRLLQNELDHQVYTDGGHYSRNPQIHMDVLTDIIAIRNTLIAAHIEVPYWLNGAIQRMVPLLRTFRHADGGLAFFNGSNTEDPTRIDMLLLKSGIKTRAVLSAPHSGFHRLSAGRTIVLIDTGIPPNKTANKWAHSGTLAFEMSSGKDRIIVNCGMPQNATEDWKQALRSTAAHSTLTVNDINSSEINIKGGYERIPGNVTSSRREIDGSTIIEASFDGYSKLFGLKHRRLIMLAPKGDEIQGEDNLIGSGQHGYNLRFHLHPNVQSTILQDKCSALLKPRRGAGWRFTCLDQTIEIEESIYFDDNSPRRRTQQIVIFGSVNETNNVIKWRLTQI